MTETFRKDIDNIIDYYSARAEMFGQLADAIHWFEKDQTEDRMWRCLFEHQLRKDETEEMFDLFDDKTIDMLAGFKVSFIIGIADEQG